MSAPETLSPQAQQNIEIGKQKKDVGDQAFKAGDVKAALRSYHEALLYFRGVHRTQPGTSDPTSPPKPKTEIDEIMEKVYSNMSACHMKTENWARVVETADKALAINEDNPKAKFRKGKALGEQGFVEKASEILRNLLVKNPPDAATITAELSAMLAKDRERQRRHNQKLRGFLSRDKSLLASGSENTPPEQVTTATIEEVGEDGN